MKFSFKAKIYKTGINWCVDVPQRITKALTPEKGFIKIKGDINGFKFSKSLVPVKDAPYRLFVNADMMKGGGTALGKIAAFTIQQNKVNVIKDYELPVLLRNELQKHNLTLSFNNLPPSRKRDILKYLSYIKTEETLQKNINKLITQLKGKSLKVRIP